MHSWVSLQLNLKQTNNTEESHISLYQLQNHELIVSWSGVKKADKCCSGWKSLMGKRCKLFFHKRPKTWITDLRPVKLFHLLSDKRLTRFFYKNIFLKSLDVLNFLDFKPKDVLKMFLFSVHFEFFGAIS